MSHGTVRLVDFLESEKDTWKEDPLKSISQSIIQYYQGYAPPKKSDKSYILPVQLISRYWNIPQCFNSGSLSVGVE